MAKIRITKIKRITENVEVDLPYYYVHHLDNETIFGMIDSKITIAICENDDQDKYEIEKKAERNKYSQKSYRRNALPDRCRWPHPASLSKMPNWEFRRYKRQSARLLPSKTLAIHQV